MILSIKVKSKKWKVKALLGECKYLVKDNEIKRGN